MALRFTTLASGSKGNCSVIGLGGKQLMIDIGLSGKSLKGRLGQVGLSIREISEVLLTHTHSDHVYDTGANGFGRARSVVLVPWSRIRNICYESRDFRPCRAVVWY